MDNDKTTVQEMAARLKEMEDRMSLMDQRIEAVTDKLTQMTEQTLEQKQAEKVFEDSIIEGGSDR